MVGGEVIEIVIEIIEGIIKIEIMIGIESAIEIMTEIEMIKMIVTEIVIVIAIVIGGNMVDLAMDVVVTALLIILNFVFLLLDYLKDVHGKTSKIILDKLEKYVSLM